MSKSGVKIVFGGASIGAGKSHSDGKTIEDLYKLLEEGDCHTIDLARLYGVSEEWVGNTGGGKRFVIDSKTPGGFVPGGSTSSGIPQHAKETVEKLGIKKLDIYYIHSPDPSLDITDMLKGVNEAYLTGYFERFGLSNFKAEDVERIYNLCKENHYPLPSVFQSSYGPVGRRHEQELFPTLRRLGIAFYAYSPLGGGLLTKTKEQVMGGGEDAGRFSQSHVLHGVYSSLYNKPSYHKALDLWATAAEETGCSRAELAYRWTAFDSALDPRYGDAIIFGGSKLSQVKETLGWLKKGSVGEDAKAKIDSVWSVIEKDAPLDNYNR